jgi:hypothetical protein
MTALYVIDIGIVHVVDIIIFFSLRNKAFRGYAILRHDWSESNQGPRPFGCLTPDKLLLVLSRFSV